MAELCLAVVALMFFLLKRRLWLPLIWHDTAIYANSHRVFGANPLRYFSLLGRPLGTLFLALTYGRSRRTGDLVFDLVITACGVMVFHLTLQLVPEAAVALMTAAGYYYLWLTPSSFEASGASLEGYSHAFSLIGLLIVGWGLRDGSYLLLGVGAGVSSIGFWVKSSTLEFLWPLALIAAERGFGLHLLIAGGAQCAVAAALVAVTVISLRRETKTDSALDGALGHIAKMVSLARHEAEGSRGQSKASSLYALSGVAKGCVQHLCVIYPLVCGYILFWSLPQIDPGLKLISVLWLAISTCALFRMRFVPLHLILGQYPLLLGASIACIRNSDIFREQPAATAAIALVIAATIFDAFKRYSHRPGFKKNYENLKRHVTDKLNGIVQAGDLVFQDTGYPQIYYELKCQAPPEAFWWADRLEGVLNWRDQRERLVRFFAEEKPDYFLAIGQKLNLSYLEQITGLRYRAFQFGFGIFYALHSAGNNAPVYDFDWRRLLTPDSARYEKDRKEVMRECGAVCRSGIAHAVRGDYLGAIACYDRALVMVAQARGVALLKAEALLALGKTAEALDAVRAELSLEPDSVKATQLRQRIEARTAADSGDGFAPCPGSPRAAAGAPAPSADASRAGARIPPAMDDAALPVVERGRQTIENFISTEDWDQACLYFKEAINSNPDDVCNTIGYGEVLKKLDRTEDARKLYEEFLARNPHDRNVRLAAECL